MTTLAYILSGFSLLMSVLLLIKTKILKVGLYWYLN